MSAAIKFRFKKKLAQPDPKGMGLTIKSQTHNVLFKRLLTYQPGTEWVLREVSFVSWSTLHCSLASEGSTLRALIESTLGPLDWADGHISPGNH